MCSFYLLSVSAHSIGYTHGYFMANFQPDIFNMFNTELLIPREGLYLACVYLRIIDSEFKQFYFSNVNASIQIV